MKKFTLDVNECKCDHCKKRTKEPVYFGIKDTWYLWFFCSQECHDVFVKLRAKNKDSQVSLVTLH